MRNDCPVCVYYFSATAVLRECFDLLQSYRIPDDRWKHTLKVNHPSLRQEIRVNDVLPRFHSFLTDVEYWCVQGSDKADNIDQVDQLFRILLTKEKREFEEFLVALWQQGYADLAARLAEEAGGLTMSDDVCVHSSHSAASFVMYELFH